MDKGTENSKVAAAQYAFREGHNDDLAAEKSFCYGTSPANIVSLPIVYVFNILTLCNHTEN